MSKLISLSHGQFAVVDDDDYEYLNQWRWSAGWEEGTQSYYAYRSERIGPGRGAGTHKYVSMHRLLMQTPKGMHTDHINKDTLDNRRQNLRVCTPSENLCNRGATRANKSGLKGAYWDKERNKWSSLFTFKGERIHLGRFATAQEAHEAWVAIAKKHHGEFLRVSNDVASKAKVEKED